jgi:hypothetical protein
MSKRNKKGLTARLGALFAPKPERKAFPHLDLLTESAARHHVSGSKRSRPARTPDAIVSKSAGKIMKAQKTDEGTYPP